MKVVYASRTGNVEALIGKLGITDGFGDVPYEVSDFLENNPSIKGVIASGDTGYGEAYCLAGDKISEDYHAPCLYKVENDGTDEDVEAIKELL